MKPASLSYDLVFLGGGLTSNLTARFLKRKHPDLKILILEKNTTTHWNPGESTVGVTGLFLIRDLGLSTYCYLNHLPKNGLRYFFHDPARDFELTRCSEIGSNILPIFPTFQVDRARLDQDLWELNQEIGIEIKTGALIKEVRMGSGETDHQIEFEREGLITRVEARWLCNTSGRGSKAAPVFEELSPVTQDQELLTAAAWGRFSHIQDMDQLGDEAWREKVGHTSRYLSTNHFMGKGYWIWAIPIDRGIVSFGIVYDRSVIQEDLGSEERFLDFIKREPFVKVLLEGSRQLDFQSHPHLSFKRAKFCSVDRWIILGDSFGFVDPFYSPGSDSIARQAHLANHLLLAENSEDLERRVELLNRYTQFEYEILKLLYQDQYAGFESFEVFNIKSLWDFHSYTNRMVWNFYSKKFEDLSWIEREVNASERSLQITSAIQKGFQDYYAYLCSNNQEKRWNQGEYSLRQNRFRIEEDMLVEFSDERSVEEHLFLCRLSLSEMVEGRFEIPDFVEHKISQDMLTFASLNSFKLDHSWLNQLLKRVSRRFSLLLLQKTSSKLQISIKPSDYRLAFPEALAGESDQIREAGSKIWRERAYNPVFDQLTSKQKRNQNGPSWKDHPII